MGKIILDRYMSPCGGMMLGAYDNRLCIADWRLASCSEAGERRNIRLMAKMKAALDAAVEYGSADVTVMAKAQLEEYFRGVRRTFDIPLLLVGTEFQRKAWDTLCTVGYGGTITYAEEARRMGHPRAVRAVGAANGANPISIIVPCHRAVASGGGMGGYGGGMDVKRFLLNLEMSGK